VTFQPALPMGGFLGWKVLERTRPAQQAAFERQPAIRRDEDYFRERIGKIDTAEQLVSDRRLLRVALGAFGLDADIDNRFFIRKVLEDGTLKPDALAMKLSDKRYQALSSAFGFGNFSTPRNKLSDFSDRMLAAWKERGFETSVGRVDDNLRLAMNARRELAELARGRQSEDAKWFGIMGQPPLRRVMETALGLPGSLAQLDVDKQREVFRAKANSILGNGSISQFSDPGKLEAVLQRFLLRADIAQSTQAQAPGTAALALLQAAATSSSGRGLIGR